LRTAEFLYIRNFAPELWPAGDPRGVEGDSFGYYDIDSSPRRLFLVEKAGAADIRRYLELAVAKRPSEELYVLKNDPAALVNVANDPRHAEDLKTSAR